MFDDKQINKFGKNVKTFRREIRVHAILLANISMDTLNVSELSDSSEYFSYIHLMREYLHVQIRAIYKSFNT